MAAFISNLWNRFCSKQAPLSIMLVGLDNSGKTSLLANLKSSSFSSRQTTSSKSSENKSPSSLTRDAQSYGDLKLIASDGEAIELVSPDQVGSFVKSDASQPTVGYNYQRLQYKGHTINVLDFSGHTKYRALWEEFYSCVDGIVFVLDSSDLIRLVVVRDELEDLLAHPFFNSLQSSPQRTKNTKISGKLAFQMAQKQLVISQGKLLQSPLEANESASARNTQSNVSKESPNSPASGTSSRSAGQRRTQVPILFLANKADLTNAADTQLIARTLKLAELSQSRHPWHIQATSVQTSQGIQEAFDWLLGELARQIGRPQAAH